MARACRQAQHREMLRHRARRHGLEQQVELAVAAHAEPPRLVVVLGEVVADDGGPAGGADPLGVADEVLLEASGAEGAGDARVREHDHPRAGPGIRGALHLDEGGEDGGGPACRHALERGHDLAQLVHGIKSRFRARSRSMGAIFAYSSSQNACDFILSSCASP